MSSVNSLFGSFVTPPLHTEVDKPSRSAQRSLNFGRSRLNSDPLAMTSDLHRLSNRSCPDMSSHLEMPPAAASQQPQRSRATDVPSRPSVGSTTVKALLTPIARRMQSSSLVTPPFRSCTSPAHDEDHLDRTLTGAEQCHSMDSEAGEPAILCPAVNDDSSQSRWSMSDYFNRYPHARLDSTGNTTRDHSFYSECNLQPLTNDVYRAGQTVDRCTVADADASTLISSIRQDRSAPLCRSPCSAPSVEGSVETSSSLDSITTNDDAAFRAGLAQLDANIASVQRRLRGSLSSPACRSPRYHQT